MTKYKITRQEINVYTEYVEAKNKKEAKTLIGDCSYQEDFKEKILSIKEVF